MHIKRIAIIGFKSYRDQVFNEPFSAKHNVVVGRNGSGKSNFFNAILFVLSEKYAHLHPNDRRELLHATAGAPVLSAYVEITFDNTDGRLVIPGLAEEAEVHIRRTIGVQKDEFRVNDKAMSSRDVRQLLEGAGFSAANPYYVVEQGRIVHITNMSEAERLNLVKEVAGTKVYDSRRRESMEILEDTKAKRDRIEETFAKLEAKRSEAEKESAECAQLREFENTMRKIEYCLYTQEAKKIQKEIDAKSAVGKRSTVADELYEAKCALEVDIRNHEEELQNQTRRIELLENERKKVESDRLMLANKRTRNDVLRGESSRKMKSFESERVKLEKERSVLEGDVHRINNEIEHKSAELRKIQSQIDTATTEQAALDADVMRMQTRRGNTRLFKSAAERNKWLTEEIDRNSEFHETHEKELQRLTASQQSLNKDIAAETESVESISESLLVDEEQIKSNEAERLDRIRARDTSHTTRRTVFQKLHASEQTLKEERNALERNKQTMDKAMGSRDIRDGLRALEETLDELKRTSKSLYDSVHGPVIKLFECDERFYTAVEVTAGNALFNVVVDTFSNGTDILKWMNAHGKKGRVTFLPLDTCTGKSSNLKATNDTTPLINHVKYDAKYEKIFEAILGGTVVAASLEVAANVSSSLNCAAVTLDGDQINKKGGLRGGFLQRTSRLELHVGMIKCTAAVEKELAVYQGLRQDLADVEQEVTANTLWIDETENANATLRANAHTSRQNLRIAHDKSEQLKRSLVRTQEAVSSTKASLEKTKETIRALTAEREAPFRSTFGSKEEAELERALSALDKTRMTITAHTEDATSRATDIEVLRDTVAKSTQRLDLIVEQLSTWTGSGLEVDNERCAIEDKALEEQIAALTKQVRSIDTEVTDLCKQKQRSDLALHEKRQAEAETRRKYDKSLEERTKAQSNQIFLNNQLEEVLVKMRQTGVSDVETGEFRTQTTKRLVEEAKRCTTAISGLAHVNRKALDQLSSIEDHIKELTTKRDGHDKELQSIHEMIQKLDEQKDEAIERTVKQVQHHFETVFLELVTAKGASASLVLLQSNAPEQRGVESYFGIRIQVCFGIGLPVIELMQLSGGQRSLVALALIFAIQRCDPAPFYLFDEIDAALDVTYRTAVANMIRRQCENTQFITATFKEEMLEAADKVYGIFFRNRVSRIREISIDDGKTLLQEEAMRAQDGPAEGSGLV